MPLKYACFLSYQGISSDYYKALVHQVYERLTDELKILIDLEKPVFSDWERFQPDSKNENYSIRALYESLCMVVLFVPRYFKTLHCALEYKAMERLEAKRLNYLSSLIEGDPQRLIFPVIIRGSENLPEVIRQNPQSIYMDDLSSSMVENSKLIKLAQQIAKCYELFEGISLGMADGADPFPWPTKDEVEDLLDESKRAKQLFPGYKY